LSATDGIDALLELHALGDVLVAYHERSINLLQFVGVPFIFVVRTAIPSLGPIAPGAIVNFGDFHEFLASEAAYEFNGVGIEEVGPQVFREALRSISPNRSSRVITHIDEEEGETHWIVPLTTDPGDEDSGPQTSFVEHYLEEVPPNRDTPMTIRDLPATATGYFERSEALTFNLVTQSFESTAFRWDDRFFDAAFPFNVFGDEDGNVWMLSTSSNQNGVKLQSYARFHRFALVDGRNKGHLQRIEPYCDKRTTPDLSVRIYTSDFLEGDLTLKETLTFTIDHSGNRYVSARTIGRFVELEFITNVLDASWSLDGYGIEGIAAGLR